MLLLACNSDSYSGDGQLIDAGVGAAHERYLLDLGEIGTGSFSFQMKGLPLEDFTLGFEISSAYSSENLCDSKPLNNLVEIQLSDSAGHQEIGASKPLKEWTWSCRSDNVSQSFVYLGDGTMGSSFVPEKDRPYSLSVAVSDPIPGQYHVKLVAIGGGWK